MTDDECDAHLVVASYEKNKRRKRHSFNLLRQEFGEAPLRNAPSSASINRIRVLFERRKARQKNSQPIDTKTPE